MEIKNLDDTSLLSRTRELVAEERRVTTQVLHHLLEIERRKLFCDLGYPSLFEYCVKELGYSESSAWRRIGSMRLMREIPEIEEKIETGTLSLSVVSRAQTFFRNEKIQEIGRKKEVLTLLERKSAREVERELVALSSTAPLHLELKFAANQELVEQLEKIKGLLAHSHPNMSLAELVEYMAKLTLDKIDPAREPKRSVATSAVNEASRAIPASLKRAIWKRDGGKCTFVHGGRRCNSNYAVQVDHIAPYALGGKTEYRNLRLLCANHNQREAIRIFGLERCEKVRPSS